LGTAIFASLAVACASAGPGRLEDDTATDAEWRALASSRPVPLPGAPRVALAGVELAPGAPWTLVSPVPLDLGLSELVVSGLLRRRDVEFVERRRFSVALEAERSGGGRPPRSPPAGMSRGAELTATAVRLPMGGGQAVLEVRLTNTQTGAIAGANRLVIPADADMVGTARAIVATILTTLDDLGIRPQWQDPNESAAPTSYRPTGIPEERLESFLAGLGAEERWNWEAARRSYLSASEREDFFEARVALARTARLRLGGTRGES
jgi:hypothetical protein